MRSCKFRIAVKQVTGYEAEQALESGTIPVEAIAAEVGYEDSSFRSLFRRMTGITPARYRQRFGRAAMR
jgi:AraC-like DNA-binding protein